jgi:hypothetical protein
MKLVLVFDILSGPPARLPKKKFTSHAKIGSSTALLPDQ